MLLPRLIPCLLVRNRGLVKTVKFGSAKYVGDPVNAVRIFNEKGADELFLADIDATKTGREPDYGLIERVAAECRMPLCYGGGVSTVAQASRILALGVEKVALSAAAIASPKLVRRIGDEVGTQSVVVVFDVKRRRFYGDYEVWTHNGTNATGHTLPELIDMVQSDGVGEIVVNSIDRDGTMSGYDLDLVNSIYSRVSVPLTVLGGAGSLEDIRTLFEKFGTLGASAGSLFIFKGKFRAVLINYPTRAEKDALIRHAMR